MDKFIQTLTVVGQTINFVTGQCLEENDAINPIDTLDQFVKLNKTQRPCPTQVTFDTYKPNDELVKYRKELEQRYSLQSHSAGAEVDEQNQEKLVLTPENKVRKLLYQLLVEIGWSQITNDEKQYLVESVKLPEVRVIVAEFLTGFNQPRKMQKDCYETLGNMCRAMLEIISDDPVQGLREIHGMLNAGIQLYMFDGGRRF